MDSDGRGGVCGRKGELQGALCDGAGSLDWRDRILTSATSECFHFQKETLELNNKERKNSFQRHK